MENKVKNLKIHAIDIQDFKNIESINTELGDWNVIGGFNWGWKSSFVEAILTAVQWNKFYGNWAVSPASLVKTGEDKAIIRLIVKWEEIEIQLEREFKKGTTKKPAGTTNLIATMNGESISQKSLDALMGHLTLDPMSLSRMTTTEQIKSIKETIWLDTSQIDKEVKDMEEFTKESRAYAKKTQSIYEDIVWAGVPQQVEVKSVSELVKKRDRVSLKEKKLQELWNKKTEITQLEEKLAQAKIDLESIKKEWGELYSETKDFGTVAEIDEEINSLETQNKSNEKYERYLEDKKKRDEAQEQLEKDSKKLSELRTKRTEIIAKSNIPKYMTISDEEWILVDGVEYKLLNTAKKIEVAIDLVLISGSPLRMIRIEQWWELDTKTLEAIKTKILENGFQIFIERPIIDKYDSIVISDGEITS